MIIFHNKGIVSARQSHHASFLPALCSPRVFMKVVVTPVILLLVALDRELQVVPALCQQRLLRLRLFVLEMIWRLTRCPRLNLMLSSSGILRKSPVLTIWNVRFSQRQRSLVKPLSRCHKLSLIYCGVEYRHWNLPNLPFGFYSNGVSAKSWSKEMDFYGSRK